MKVRAAVLEEFGQPLVVQEIELAEPNAGEALVRLEACGVYTDLYSASGADPTGYTDCVLGRGAPASWRRLGPTSRSFSPATTWSPSSRPVWGVPALPRSAHEPLRRDPRPAGSASCRTATRFSRNGKDIRHFMGTSTFAEYTVVPEIALAKVNPDAPLAACAPFACGLSTGMGAALATALVTPGSTCVVFGCGLVGLGAVIGCRLAGADRIVAVDLSEARLEEARRHGATDTRVAAEDVVDWIRTRPAASGPTSPSRRPERPGDAASRRGGSGGLGLATMIGVAGKGETLDFVPRF